MEELLRAHLTKIDLSAAPGITIVVRPSEKEIEVTPGPPAFLAIAHEEDLIDLIEGYASLDAALIDGRVKIEGDLGAAMKWLPILFKSGGSRPAPSSSSRGS